VSYLRRVRSRNGRSRADTSGSEPRKKGLDVCFTIWVAGEAFECVVTRQALEDLAAKPLAEDELVDVYREYRSQVDLLASARVERGLRWPKLVVTMDDVRTP